MGGGDWRRKGGRGAWGEDNFVDFKLCGVRQIGGFTAEKTGSQIIK